MNEAIGKIEVKAAIKRLIAGKAAGGVYQERGGER